MSADRLPNVLPRGRHAAPRHVVEASQRVRLLEAMAAAVAERGYAATSVADVLGRAHVSRKSFYEHFANKEDCFLQAYDLGTEILLTAIERAVDAAPDPVAAVRAGARAYLAELVARPAFARTFLIEALAAGPAALERRSAVHAAFAAQQQRINAAAREVMPELPEVPAYRFRACVGALEELVRERLRTRGTDDLLELEGQVLDVVLTILVGGDLAEQLLGG